MNIFEFRTKNGRLPHAKHGENLLSYQAWLLPAIQEIHYSPEYPLVPNRWGFYFKMIELLGEGTPPPKILEKGSFGGIPQMDFSRSCPKAVKNLHACIDIASEGGKFGRQAFARFREFLAFACGITDIPPSRVSEEAQQELYETFDPVLMLESPHDYLGTIIAEGTPKGWNTLAFYPTPHGVCSLLVGLMGLTDNIFQAVYEPCCGSGRMLMSASNHSVAMRGEELDLTLVQIVRIYGAFYIPWIFPRGIIECKDVLTQELKPDGYSSPRFIGENDDRH